MKGKALKFEQIIYIDFEGKPIGTIFEHDNGYWSVRWEKTDIDPVVHTDSESAKQYVKENFNEHL